jgi:antitoxin component YwqK of YwqJK toxin-antitoxin module
MAYYENGQLMGKGSIKNGEKDGVWEFYFEDGQLKNIEFYKDGELVKNID